MLVLGGVFLLVKLAVIVYLVRARNAESARADAAEVAARQVWAELQDTRGDLAEREQRLRAIRQIITRRPPRRKWLRIAHRVTRLVA